MLKSFKDAFIVLLFILGISLLFRGMVGLVYAEPSDLQREEQEQQEQQQGNGGTFTDNLPITCGDYLGLVAFLTTRYGEVSYFRGNSDSGEVFFFLNLQQGTYTVIERLFDSDVACVLSSGSNFSIRNFNVPPDSGGSEQPGISL